MQLITLSFRGWKIIVALGVLLAGCLGWSAWVQKDLDTTIQPLLRKRLIADLRLEAGRRHLPGVSGQTPTREQGQQLSEEFKQIDTLQILSVQRRGIGGHAVAKVEYAIAGKPASALRYYRLAFSLMLGWQVEWATTELTYRTSYF